MSSATFPPQLIEARSWTTHKAKRPFVNIGDWARLTSYEQAAVQLKARNHDGLSFHFSPLNDIVGIDIDFYGTEQQKKETQQQAAEFKKYAALAEWLINEVHAATWQAAPALRQLLMATFTEVSMSKTGFHVFALLPREQKMLVSPTWVSSNPTQDFPYKGQCNFNSGHFTMTGAPLPGSPLQLALIDWNTIKDYYINARTRDVAQEEPPLAQRTPVSLGSQSLEDQLGTVTPFAHVKQLLAVIPIDQNERVKRAWLQLTQRDYCHYEFWIAIGMALRSNASSPDLEQTYFDLWHSWSADDPIAYKGHADVIAHWRSFQSLPSTQPRITTRTLQALAAALRFEYPLTKASKSGKTSLPLVNEWDNFTYLLAKYNIQIHDVGQYFITGDIDICERFFLPPTAHIEFDKYYGPFTRDGLEACFTHLCQASNWRGLQSTMPHVKRAMAQLAAPLDLFNEWLNTPYDRLPQALQQSRLSDGSSVHLERYNATSTLNHLYELFNIQASSSITRDLQHAHIRATLMQMLKLQTIRQDESKFSENGGMLILHGRENTYKSTAVHLLLPHQLKPFLHKSVNMMITGDKTQRDLLREFGRKAIMQFDEFEGLLDMAKRSSWLKNLLANDDIRITDIYETNERVVPRKAIIIGTTNQDEHQLASTGNRRMWFVHVDKIDTKAMLKVNWHFLYNNLRQELLAAVARDERPWLLNDGQIALLNEMNQAHEAVTAEDAVLDELWPTYGERMPEDYLKGLSLQLYNGHKVMKVSRVYDIINTHGLGKTITIPRLRQALIKHCSRWTGTETKQQDLGVGPNGGQRGVIIKGQWCQGLKKRGNSQSYNYVKFVMPPAAVKLLGFNLDTGENI